MNYTFGSSRYFGSIVRLECIDHNKYTGRIISMCSKTTPNHIPVQKTEINFSYVRKISVVYHRNFAKKTCCPYDYWSSY